MGSWRVYLESRLEMDPPRGEEACCRRSKDFVVSQAAQRVQRPKWRADHALEAALAEAM